MNIECGGTGRMWVSINNCKATVETHGYVHSDYPYATYSGSTTIDIIPIFESIPIPKGKDDISRLTNHELIYTGGLRATIPSITHHVPYKGKKIRVSFEKFALISDVHRILNNILEEEYINDTADNRSKSLENCYARLSRVVCMDL